MWECNRGKFDVFCMIKFVESDFLELRPVQNLNKSRFRFKYIKLKETFDIWYSMWSVMHFAKKTYDVLIK